MTARFPGRAAIDSYGAGGFGFAGMSHRGSILALPSGIYAWTPDPAALTQEDFALPLAEADAIELLIIGTGLAMMPLARLRAALRSSGLNSEAMATGHAVATYNLLLEEKRQVAAALIAVSHPA
ncbi:MAG: Mth938-like domain-containing protein [Aestuariivirga sp.]|uniref:Mth938-like domain-containing protein n=1 Tax=Aestuariivirga sp. TaxID=2650926 RepID=UPI0038CFBC07